MIGMLVPPIPASFLQPQTPMVPSEAESIEKAAETLLDEMTQKEKEVTQMEAEVIPKTVQVTEKKVEVTQKEKEVPQKNEELTPQRKCPMPGGNFMMTPQAWPLGYRPLGA